MISFIIGFVLAIGGFRAYGLIVAKGEMKKDEWVKKTFSEKAYFAYFRKFKKTR